VTIFRRNDKVRDIYKFGYPAVCFSEVHLIAVHIYLLITQFVKEQIKIVLETDVLKREVVEGEKVEEAKKKIAKGNKSHKKQKKVVKPGSNGVEKSIQVVKADKLALPQNES